MGEGWSYVFIQIVRDYHLGQNKIRNNGTPPPLINDELAVKPKQTIFPSLKWGKGGQRL